MTEKGNVNIDEVDSTYVQTTLELAVTSQLDTDNLIQQKADEVHGLGNGAGIFYCVGHFV